MLSVDNVSKTFGGRRLLDRISFQINARERVGLVGRNGHGKTTLLRMIIGQEPYDSGHIAVPKTYRLGYVSQKLNFTAATILEEGMLGLPANEQTHHWKVERVLAGLGFSTADLTRHPETFSGGYQVRLNLAKVLVAEPDLLLLDEPTNYLDITSIRWIEQFLLHWPHELILITHDRGFMDQVVTHTLGIHRCKVRKIAGNTQKYYEQIAKEEEIYEKTRLNDERRRREIEQFITRFRAKARLANLVQSRIKTLAKLEKKDKLAAVRSLDFAFRAKPFKSKQPLSVEKLTFGYEPDRPIIENLSFGMRAGERIGIIGPNGQGKTTLLKLLAGTLAPQSGKVAYHPGVTKGVFEQTNLTSLVDSRTVEEEIWQAGSDLDRQQVRKICGVMMFEQDNALKKISVLSGGEKSRVMLGRILVTPINLLLLDEPTNHLDMDACDTLLAALDAFPGAVVLVTHNEMFLHALADRLVVFQSDGVEVFEGGYGYFLESCGWADETVAARPNSPARAAKSQRKELRRARSAIIAQRAQVIKPIEKKIAAAEEEIERHEAHLAEYNQALISASQNQDGPRIATLSQSIHQAQQTIDRRFNELESLYQQLEDQQDDFQKQLDRLASD